MKKKLSKQISLGIDPLTGKRIRKRIYGDTAAEISKKEKQAIKEHERQGNPSNVTFKEYADRWYDAYMSTKAYATQHVFFTVLNKCEPIYWKRMSDITRNDLQAIVNASWDQWSVAKILCTRLSAIWASAVLDGIVQKNIAYKLHRPKQPKTNRRPFTDKELAVIKSTVFSPPAQLLVDILLQFGLRPGEALALDVTSVDRDNKLLHITKGLAHRGETGYIKSTKTEEIRSLPIPDELLPRLKPLNKNSTYFFVNEKGNLYTKYDCQKISDEIITTVNEGLGGTSKLKLTDMTLYTFRHHKATMLYYAKGSLSTKAKAMYMGHSEEMFIKTYSHLIPDKEDTELLRKIT